MILHHTLVSSEPILVLFSFRHSGQIWVGALGHPSRPHGQGLQVFDFWSYQEEVPRNKESSVYQPVVDELTRRVINGADQDRYKTFAYWPESWAYWGPGKPKPISDYLNSTEVESMLAQYGLTFR